MPRNMELIARVRPLPADCGDESPDQIVIDVVSRRVTTLNQAWSWADAAGRLVQEQHPNPNVLSLYPLAWLECQMSWICADLQEAGAWSRELELPFVSSQHVKLLCRQVLDRIVELPTAQCECISALVEAQVRARACLIALDEQVTNGAGHGQVAA